MPKLRNGAKERLEAASKLYHHQLLRDPDAKHYLEARGMRVAQMIRYRLGYVREPIDDEHQLYRGRLCIPYLLPGNRVDSIRFRAVGEGQAPKYLSLQGSDSGIFNVPVLHMGYRTIVVCEGELDAIIANEFGGVPAVGIPGVKTWRSIYRHIFAEYELVFVVGDGDTAGREFVDKVCHELPNARPLNMTDNLDVNSLYLRYGEDVLRRFFRAAAQSLDHR